jgi:hypothetical protein
LSTTDLYRSIASDFDLTDANISCFYAFFETYRIRVTAGTHRPGTLPSELNDSID